MDGTLYRQKPLRLRMAAELAFHAWIAPFETIRIVRILRAFRILREKMRQTKASSIPYIELQYRETARLTRIDPNVTARIVGEWMEHRPLRHLLVCRREGLVSFLEQCRTRGIAIGAYSDYPTRAKVEALQISAFFDLHLCSTDPEINSFKPSPAGILEACRRWRLKPESVLYVGDRRDVDGEASRMAGTAFVFMGRGQTGELAARDFSELSDLLEWE